MKSLRFLAFVALLAIATIAPAQNPAYTKRLPTIEFDETPLSDAADYFQSHGVNILLHPEVDATSPLTLHLSDLTVGQALLCVTDQLSLDYRADPHAWVILPVGQGELAKRIPPPLASTAAFGPVLESRTHRLDRIDFDEMPIGEVIRYLNARHKRERPDAPSLNLVINNYIDPEIPVTMNLTDTTVATLLGHLADTASVEIRPEPYAIFIDPPGTAALQQARLDATRPRSARPRSPRPRPFTRRLTSGTLVQTYVNKDPRSPANDEYVSSAADDVRTRSNAMNNVYRWKNGKWTFVRYGGGELDAEGRRIVTPTLDRAKK